MDTGLGFNADSDIDSAEDRLQIGLEVSCNIITKLGPNKPKINSQSNGEITGT